MSSSFRFKNQAQESEERAKRERRESEERARGDARIAGQRGVRVPGVAELDNVVCREARHNMLLNSVKGVCQLGEPDVP
jgi:hypothetical protein